MQVVVAGAGRWGQIHCEKVRASRWATLAGVVDPDRGNAQYAAGKYDVRAFPSLEECHDVDFLIIASPLNEVASLVEQACQRGVSFLAEKPVAVSSDAIKRLEQLRADANVVACVGYQLRFHPELKTFTVGGLLKIVREECSFESLWALICDGGVHDIDLGIRLAGGFSRLTEVVVRSSSVDVYADSLNGTQLHWQWRIGANLTRRVQSGTGEIDFTRASEDLVSHQWAGVRQRLRGFPSSVATLNDARSVSAVLDALRTYVEIA